MTRQRMIELGLVGGMCLALVPAIVTSARALLADAQPTHVIEVLTHGGNVYIVGSGSSCSHALENARYPEDWLRIVCRLDVPQPAVHNPANGGYVKLD